MTDEVLNAQTYCGEKVHFAQPDECPLCHYHLKPTYHLCILRGARQPALQNKKPSLTAVFQCTRSECNGLFLAQYARNPEALHMFGLSRCEPIQHQVPTLSDEVRSLSPTFTAIYDQALAAQEAGLDHLVGMGLRKALEFLVKDFAISQDPDNEGNIRRKLLKPCIDEYIDDATVKEQATHAAFLGNDESHYERRLTGFDVEDLKMLIELALNAVTNVLRAKAYRERIQRARGLPA